MPPTVRKRIVTMRIQPSKWAARALLGSGVLATAAALGGCASQAETGEPVRPAIVAQPQPAAGQTDALYTGDVHARYESALGFRVGGKIKRRLVAEAMFVLIVVSPATMVKSQAHFLFSGLQCTHPCSHIEVFPAVKLRYKQTFCKAFLP